MARIMARRKRKHNLNYELPGPNGNNILVCKTMFLHTLGLRTDGTITEYVNKKLKLYPEAAVGFWKPQSGAAKRKSRPPSKGGAKIDKGYHKISTSTPRLVESKPGNHNKCFVYHMFFHDKLFFICESH